MPGDRAGAVAEHQGPAEADLRRGGDAEVAGRRQPHADEADGGGEDRSHQERERPAEPRTGRSSPAARSSRFRREQDDDEDDDQDRNRS